MPVESTDTYKLLDVEQYDIFDVLLEDEFWSWRILIILKPKNQNQSIAFKTAINQLTLWCFFHQIKSDDETWIQGFFLTKEPKDFWNSLNLSDDEIDKIPDDELKRFKREYLLNIFIPKVKDVAKGIINKIPLNSVKKEWVLPEVVTKGLAGFNELLNKLF